MPDLTVVFDFKSPHAYLSLEPTLSMLEDLDVQAKWQPKLVAAQQRARQPEVADDRGAAHRWHRALYRINDLRRYARARGLAEQSGCCQRGQPAPAQARPSCAEGTAAILACWRLPRASRQASCSI